MLFITQEQRKQSTSLVHATPLHGSLAPRPPTHIVSCLPVATTPGHLTSAAEEGLNHATKFPANLSLDPPIIQTTRGKAELWGGRGGAATALNAAAHASCREGQ